MLEVIGCTACACASLPATECWIASQRPTRRAPGAMSSHLVCSAETSPRCERTSTSLHDATRCCFLHAPVGCIKPSCHEHEGLSCSPCAPGLHRVSKLCHNFDFIIATHLWAACRNGTYNIRTVSLLPRTCGLHTGAYGVVTLSGHRKQGVSIGAQRSAPSIPPGARVLVTWTVANTWLQIS